jgi:hypothetical protein
MMHSRITDCAHCAAPIDLNGRVGRPPRYCDQSCRRAGYAAAERDRREARKQEINRLRELVRIYESALAA